MFYDFNKISAGELVFPQQRKLPKGDLLLCEAQEEQDQSKQL